MDCKMRMDSCLIFLCCLLFLGCCSATENVFLECDQIKGEIEHGGNRTIRCVLNSTGHHTFCSVRAFKTCHCGGELCPCDLKTVNKATKENRIENVTVAFYNITVTGRYNISIDPTSCGVPVKNSVWFNVTRADTGSSSVDRPVETGDINIMAPVAIGVIVMVGLVGLMLLGLQKVLKR